MMNQYSTSGESVEIELLSNEVIFIDPLYFRIISEDVSLMQNVSDKCAKDFIRAIEEIYFPYGGGTLIGLKQLDTYLSTYLLDLHEVRGWDCDEYPELKQQGVEKTITVFGIDSASFLLFDFKNFPLLLRSIPHESLEGLNIAEALEVVGQVNLKIGNRGWAYVESPGIGEGYEFTGDGSYIIE